MNYLDFASLFHNIIQLLYALGFFSELLVFILVIYLIYPDRLNLTTFLVGLSANSLINRLLKPAFRDPRPSDPIKFLESERFPKKLEYTKNSNYYGMPSGHSQNVAFSLAYLYWTIRESDSVKLTSIVLGSLTVFERWWFRNHTIAQLVTGVIVGILLARFTLWLRDRIVVHKIV